MMTGIGPAQGVIMNSQPEESDQVRRNGILGRAIGLDAWEVAQYVTNIQRHDSGSGYTVHFSIETPDQVRKKVDGLDAALFIHTGPIDFEGSQRNAE